LVVLLLVDLVLVVRLVVDFQLHHLAHRLGCQVLFVVSVVQHLA
jgi:hypothetical protein